MPETQHPDKHGKVYPLRSAFLRIHAGEAEADGQTYELSTSTSATPLILSKTSGHTWGISWQELLDMAIAAGVDVPDAAEHLPAGFGVVPPEALCIEDAEDKETPNALQNHD